MTQYNYEFYSTRYDDTCYSADKIITSLLEYVPGISSAIDVGCGVGTFLSVLQGKGVNDVVGVDGSWVDTELLAIDKNSFIPANLTNPPKLDKKYDLAISLEVAEHLSQENASDFIEYLCSLSDVVLFSAAIPGQGGVGHVNEQWQSYWINIFHENGYFVYDCIRPTIWNDEDIFFWYKQNIFIFSKSKSLVNYKCIMPNNVVHPELYESILKNNDFLLKRRKYLHRIKNKIRRLLNI